MSISSWVIIAIPLKQINNSKNRKTTTYSYYNYLKS